MIRRLGEWTIERICDHENIAFYDKVNLKLILERKNFGKNGRRYALIARPKNLKSILLLILLINMLYRHLVSTSRQKMHVGLSKLPFPNLAFDSRNTSAR